MRDSLGAVLHQLQPQIFSLTNVESRGPMDLYSTAIQSIAYTSDAEAIEIDAQTANFIHREGYSLQRKVGQGGYGKVRDLYSISLTCRRRKDRPQTALWSLFPNLPKRFRHLLPETQNLKHPCLQA